MGTKKLQEQDNIISAVKKSRTYVVTIVVGRAVLMVKISFELTQTFATGAMNK